jgi:hypothetical protein
MSRYLKDEGLVQPIKHFVELYVQSLPAVPTSFGAWVLCGFVGQRHSWPVVKWTEGQKEAVAIFKVEPGKSIYSTVIHYGVKSERPFAPMWSDSSLYWIVWDIEDLQESLSAVNKALSLLYLNPEKLAAFLDPNQKECSDDELLPLS